MLMITKGKKVNEISGAVESQPENGEQLPLPHVQQTEYRRRRTDPLAIRHGLFNAETLLSSE